MKPKIIPAIIAKNQKEFNERFSKVKNVSSIVHLDIMDGKFVKNKSLMFDLKLPRGKKYEAHLMVRNPEKFINKIKADVFLIHVESNVNIEETIKKIKKKKKKVGLVLNPGTSIGKIKNYLNKVDRVLIMTVHPGKYGAKFLPSSLSKIKQLRNLKPKLNIEVDGSINLKTISKVSKAGANIFVSGSYIQKSGDAKKAVRELEKRLKI